MLKYIERPKGVFKGLNIMTPNIICFCKLRIGYAELAEGRGIENEKIFGVTVRPDEDRSMAVASKRRSKMFHSRAAAEAYIEELS